MPGNMTNESDRKKVTFNRGNMVVYMNYPDEELYYGLKYWLFLLNRSKYIFGFSFVV